MVNWKRMFGYALCLIFLFALTACSGSATSRSTGTYASDEWITAKVNTNLTGDPVTKARDINVDTFRGTVQLSGFVDSQEEKERATQLAQSVDGVKKVVNNLVVKKPKTP
jgi:hyperosmotically inducible protein